MKRLIVLPAVVWFVCAITGAQRLPDVAAPDHYSVTFAPNFTTDKFAGEETISIRVLKPTSTITLNSAEIEFQDATITAGGAEQKAKVTLQPDREMAELTVEKPLAVGPAKIHIRFTGTLNNELRGLYLSKTPKRKYAATQFEATDARRALPSFDEPAYKAVFDITAIIDKGDTAISNSKIASDTPGPGADKHTVKFAATPKMSVYLVALAVGDWECAEGGADGIPIRICSVPGTKQNMTFALKSAEEIMKFYNRYFTIKYPYGKLDVVGLPDFAAGAMENTAAIFSRDVLIVMDDKTASENQRKSVAAVMSHEMAHMWFGDLVTMQWWDDVWLNEGFATWMAPKPLEAWKPEWRQDVDEVGSSSGAMGVDSLATTRAIHAGTSEAQTPDQINELFDGIAYGKAGAVLRMVENYLGSEGFRAGVNLYLRKHQYANATSADFWNAVAQASGKPVDKIMPTFVTQPGVPLVSVESKCTGNNTAVTLSQQRYFSDRKLFAKGTDQLWQVPVCLKTPSADGKAGLRCEVVAQKQQTVQLNGCAKWVYGNGGAAGYFRSNQDREAVRAIASDAEKALTPGERLAFLTNEWALVQVGQHDVGDYLGVAQNFKSDRTPQILGTIAGRVERIHTYLITDANRPQFEAWVRDFYRPLLREVGWKPAPNESLDARQLRGLAVDQLGEYGRDQQVIAESRKLAEQYIEDTSSVPSDLIGPVLSIAARNGDAALYDKLLNAAKNSKVPTQYYRFLNRLTEFSDPSLLKRTLELAISPDVRSQDSANVLANVLANPDGRDLAWTFIKTHWDDIGKRLPNFGAAGAIVGTTGVFCDARSRDDVQQFFTEHKLPQAERTLKQAVNRINDCIELRNQQAPKLADWLRQHGGTVAGR
jgi:aminopeptidase N